MIVDGQLQEVSLTMHNFGQNSINHDFRGIELDRGSDSAGS